MKLSYQAIIHSANSSLKIVPASYWHLYIRPCFEKVSCLGDILIYLLVVFLNFLFRMIDFLLHPFL